MIAKLVIRNLGNTSSITIFRGRSFKIDYVPTTMLDQRIANWTSALTDMNYKVTVRTECQ